jgi:hypothetical protein
MRTVSRHRDENSSRRIVLVSEKGRWPASRPAVLLQQVNPASVRSDAGYKADLVIFEKDLYAVAPEDFTKEYPRVLATYVNGTIAYAAG